MLPKTSASLSCFAKTTHYTLWLKTIKTATHRDNVKSDRVVWNKNQEQNKSLIEAMPISMHNDVFSVWVFTLGQLQAQLIQWWGFTGNLNEADINPQNQLCDVTFVSQKTCHPCTEDNQATGSRQNYLPPRDFLPQWGMVHWPERSKRWPDQDRAGQGTQRLRGVGV